jgi:tetratricopeptide (TPR) repeat protein
MGRLLCGTFSELKKSIQVAPRSCEISRHLRLNAPVFGAEQFTRETLGKLPDAAGLYHYQLGICYLAAGQLEQAKAAFAQMPASYDPFGYGTMNKVVTALYLRDYESATRYLAAGPPLLPDSAQDRVRCPRSFLGAQITRASRGHAESQAAFAAVRDEVVASWPDILEDPSRLTVLARIDAALGRKDDAIREAQRAVELRPISRMLTRARDTRETLRSCMRWSAKMTQPCKSSRN